jgi:acyl dehydratase
VHLTGTSLWRQVKPFQLNPDSGKERQVNQKESSNQERQELVFSELQEGRVFRTLEFKVTEDLVEQYMEAVGDRHPLYWDEIYAKDGPFGTSIGPPGLAAIYSRLSYLQDHSMPSGGVLAKQEFEFNGPIRVGETLRVTAWVVERFTDKKQRKRVNFLIEAKNQEGDPVSITRLYAIWPK